MATVIFYNFILLSSTFFVWLSEKCRGGLERYFFLGIAFLLVLVPAAIRYDVGTDYVNYLTMFHNSWELEDYKYKESLFYFINIFYQSIGAHFQWVFATFAFIFTAVAFKTYPRKQAWVMHLALIALLYFQSFNIVRQAVAIVLCLLALKEITNGHTAKFIFIILVSSLFHQSSLLFLLIGLVSKIPLNNKVKMYSVPVIFLVFTIALVFILPMVLYVIEWILLKLGLIRFANYFGNDTHFIPREFGTGLGFLINLSFLFFVIFNTKKLLRKNPRYWTMIVLMMAYTTSLLLSSQIVIFGRAAMIFLPALIFSVYVAYVELGEYRIKRAYIGFFLLFLVLSFFKESFGTPNHYYDPNIVPYKNIFEVCF